MKDRSLLFFSSVLIAFLVFGSVLFYRSSPELLPERTETALRTAGFRSLSVAFDRDKVLLLGEAPTSNKLHQAAEVIGRVKGVASVDISHATVKPRLAPPHLSLAFVGNQISARGQVSSEETKAQVLANLGERFPEAKIDHDRLVVRSDVEDFGGFAEAPLSLPGVGERERERGIVAAVGRDVAWEVMPSGAGIEKIVAGLATVLPESEVAETLDEFDDVLTTENLRDYSAELRGNLENTKRRLAAKEEKVESLNGELANSQATLREMSGRLQATEMALAMTKDELGRRDDELAAVRGELMAAVKHLAEAETARASLDGQLKTAGQRLAAAESNLGESRRREVAAREAIDKLNGQNIRMESEVAQLGSELERGKAASLASEKEAESRIAEVTEKLESAEVRIRDGEAKIEAMAAQHAAESAAADRQIEALKAEAGAAVTKLQGEIQRLEGALIESEANPAATESRIERGAAGPVRPAPDSVSEAVVPNLARDKVLDSVRGAAATAAERARAAAADSVGRAEALRLRSSVKPAVKSKKEPDPSGKPAPMAPDLKLETARRLGAKNANAKGRG